MDQAQRMLGDSATLVEIEQLAKKLFYGEV
nr:MAG TPA: hypothetical protein [Caudoviricetes sp.]